MREDFDEQEIQARLARFARAAPQGATPEGAALFEQLVSLRHDRKASLELIRTVLMDVSTRSTPPLILAFWADHHGDSELALAALQEMRAMTGRVDASIWTPLLKNVRSTDGFKDLVRAHGLEAYWRTTGNWGEFCKPVNETEFVCA